MREEEAKRMQRYLYLALGDSITAGYGASDPRLTFVHHVSEHTRATGMAQRTVMIAQNGWTSADLVRAAATLGQSVWASTNVITLLTGGNDLRQLLRRQFWSFVGNPITPQVVSTRIHGFSYQLDGLCSVIQQRHIPYVVLATLYNPAPNYPLAVSAVEQLNDVIRRTSLRYGFALADVHAAFEQQQPDFIKDYRSGRLEDLAIPVRRPIHPNNAGHRTIADLLIRQLQATNTRPRRSFRKEGDGFRTV